MSKILVIGAGELGSQVLLSLAQHPQRNNANISVLLRESSIASTAPQKVQERQTLQSLGVQFLPGDIVNDTEAHLSNIFQQYDTVISCTGFVAGPGTQLKIARAVLAAKVARFVPWQFGVDYDLIGRGSAQTLFDEQLDVRDLLRSQSRTSWVIISTGMFTSFLFEPSFGVVDLATRTIQALGSFDTKVSVTAPDDIGRITAEAVLGSRNSAFRNKPIFVAGDTLSYAELADLVEDITGHRFTRKVRTVEAARADLAREPDNSIFKYEVVFGQGRGVSWELESTWNHQLGIRLTTAKEWAHAHLNV